MSGLPTPVALQAPAKAAAVEEAVSVLRHELRNKLASLRNSVFYVQRKLQKATDLLAQDPRVGEFLKLMDSELDACTQLLAARSRRTAAATDEVALDALLAALTRELALPAGISVQSDVPPLQVRAARAELELAIFSLVENAVDALSPAGGVIRITAVEEGASIRLSVVSAAPLEVAPEQAVRPFFSTREGRTGLGLAVVKRLAAGWGGKFELLAEAGAVRATLLAPKVGGRG